MTTDSQPLVSVITPVYNEEAHLAECIESVLAQTYRNWTYTIVDNCSTDRSVEIARQYAARDPRIQVVENREFVRALANFNRALRHVSPQSKYCKLVLGDDWIYPECLERMVAVAEAHPSVGLVGAYALEGTKVSLTGLSYQQEVLTGRDACRRHLLEGLHVFGTQTSVLYRADLVLGADAFYNESNVQADTESFFDVLSKSDFGFVHQVLTFTRVRPGSIHQVSMAMETSWAALLHLMLAYGSTCLTAEEQQEVLARHLAGYYRFLGKTLIVARNKKVWRYHRDKMIAAGVGFSRARVFAGALAGMAEAVLNPQKSIAALLNRSVGARASARP